MRILARVPDLQRDVPPEAARVALAGPEAGEAQEPTRQEVLRQPLASRLARVVSPRRRGLRQIRAGWGSIGFLALLAAGIWSVAWWQDHQHAQRQRKNNDTVAPQMASTPLDMAEQVVR